MQPTVWHPWRVDTDAFRALHEPEWSRLRTLIRRRGLSGIEVDELTRLYQSAAGDLAAVRSSAPDPVLISQLSSLVAEARTRVASGPGLGIADVVHFLRIDLPAAFYRVRWWTLITAVLFIVIALTRGFWVVESPAAQAALGSPNQLREYAQQAFEAYYSNYAAPDFAAQVWTNNAWIAAQAVAGGVTGIWPAYLLLTNAAAVGEAGAIMHVYSDLGVFFGLILPHGLLEITAILVAIGAGFRVFWALVVPGRRSRKVALAEEGRLLISVAVGLVGVLAVAGIIEATVTPSGLPGPVKIGIGALALLAFGLYALWLGRRVTRAGASGDLPEYLAGYQVAEVG